MFQVIGVRVRMTSVLSGVLESINKAGPLEGLMCVKDPRTSDLNRFCSYK